MLVDSACSQVFHADLKKTVEENERVSICGKQFIHHSGSSNTPSFSAEAKAFGIRMVLDIIIRSLALGLP